MERKTIGAFIAVLRKANGLTQQELADKLNVSNKAVSRWERDECAPDITLIPALAEILGVTCDELLKGERITSGFQQERSEPKIDRQIKMLINRSISKFTLLIWISLAFSLVGLVCMFGISYGAFRPVIGFAVMCVFAVAAFVIAAIATTKMKGAKSENELFENAEVSSVKKFDKTLASFSFIAFFAAISVVAISFPLVIYLSDYVNSVLIFSVYLKHFCAVVFALGIVWIIFKDKYCIWITEQPYKINFKLILMNGLQLGAIVVATVLFIIRPYFEESYVGITVLILLIVGCAFLAVSAIIFMAFIIACKEDRKKLALSGVRNLFLIIPSAVTILVHSVEF
nr:helix-turn-helix transcriptional regulator [Clostridia bacterium]